MLIIEAGGYIDQNTLNFNADTGETSVLRSKEMANDYRYFPEPDLAPLQLSEAYVQTVKESLPALPNALFEKYTEKLGLSEYDANVIIADKDFAHYFEELIKNTDHYKAAANWLMGHIKSYLNENNIAVNDLKIKPATLAGIIKLVDAGKINNSVAWHKLFPGLLNEPNKTPEQVAKDLNLLISEDNADLNQFILDALAKYPDKVIEYRKGKKGVVGLFMGEIMKLSKGKIDPQQTNKLLLKELEAK